MTMNPNLKPHTALTPCYDAAGILWAVRIAKGQPGAGQFTGKIGLNMLRHFCQQLIPAVTMIALTQAAMMTNPARSSLTNTLPDSAGQRRATKSAEQWGWK